jgi:hypothetical protein
MSEALPDTLGEGLHGATSRRAGNGERGGEGKTGAGGVGAREQAGVGLLNLGMHPSEGTEPVIVLVHEGLREHSQPTGHIATLPPGWLRNVPIALSESKEVPVCAPKRGAACILGMQPETGAMVGRALSTGTTPATRAPHFAIMGNALGARYTEVEDLLGSGEV